VVLARFADRFDQLARDLKRRVAARGVKIVVLEKRRGGQHDIGERRGLGHELLVHAREQVFAGQAGMYFVQFRADHRRVGVLDQQRGDGRTVLERFGISSQDRPEARLIEVPHRAVDHVEAFDQRAVERIDPGMAIERATAGVLPRSSHCRHAAHCVHVRRAVA
jgi:hypothetical protein